MKIIKNKDAYVDYPIKNSIFIEYDCDAKPLKQLTLQATSDWWFECHHLINCAMEEVKFLNNKRSMIVDRECLIVQKILFEQFTQNDFLKPIDADLLYDLNYLRNEYLKYNKTSFESSDLTSYAYASYSTLQKLIKLLPWSYLETRTMLISYNILDVIYNSSKDVEFIKKYNSNEWNDFFKIIEREVINNDK